MSRVFIGLGSNQGNRISNIKKAINMLNKYGVPVKKISSFYETSPVGYENQRWFINAVCEGVTSFQPVQLLYILKSIERAFGRTKDGDQRPRKIDLDILLYANDVVKTKKLTIPHPQMKKRAFVLVPLAELYPGLKFPKSNKTIMQMAGEIKNGQIVNRLRKK